MPYIFHNFSWILIGKWNTDQDPDKDPRIKFCLLAKRKRILWDPDPKHGFSNNELISKYIQRVSTVTVSKTVQSYIYEQYAKMRTYCKPCILTRTLKLLNYTIHYTYSVYNVLYK